MGMIVQEGSGKANGLKFLREGVVNAVDVEEFGRGDAWW